MGYVKQNWQDGPGGGTPISASRLTHLEDGLFETAQQADETNDVITTGRLSETGLDTHIAEQLSDDTTEIGSAVKATTEAIVDERVPGVVTAALSANPAVISEAVEMAQSDAGLLRIRGFVIHGDSFAERHAAYLTDLVDAFGVPVVTNGIGGQQSPQVAARNGGDPMRITISGNSLPATGTVSVTAITEADGTTLNPLIMPTGSSGTRTMTVEVCGIVCTLTGVTASNVCTYTLTRNLPASAATPIPAGTPALAGFQWLDHFPILYGPRNDIGKDAADGFRQPLNEIVPRYGKMLAWTNQGPRAILLSVFSRSDETADGKANRVALNNALRDAYPRNYLDAAAFLRTDAAFAAAGISRTTQDDSDIAAGMTPTSFLSDTVHLNANGYKALNSLIISVAISRGLRQAITPEPTVHSNGVAGATHRYVPAFTHADLAPGAGVDNLADLIGTLHLAAGAGSVLPTIQSVSGQRVLRWSSATNRQLSAAVDLNGPITLAIVAKSQSAGFNFLQGAGYRIQRTAASTTFALGARNAANTATGLCTLTYVDDFVVLFALIDSTPTGSRFAVNGTVSADAGAIGAIDSTYDSALAIGLGTTGGTTTDIVELNVWPSVLDSTQRAAHIAAMKAQWTMLPA